MILLPPLVADCAPALISVMKFFFLTFYSMGDAGGHSRPVHLPVLSLRVDGAVIPLFSSLTFPLLPLFVFVFLIVRRLFFGRHSIVSFPNDGRELDPPFAANISPQSDVFFSRTIPSGVLQIFLLLVFSLSPLIFSLASPARFVESAPSCPKIGLSPAACMRVAMVFHVHLIRAPGSKG